MTIGANTIKSIYRWLSWKERLRMVFSGASRRQILISVSSLAGSGMISVALRFIGGIIQGRFIGPETLGYYTMFTIIPGYMLFLHMGVFTSLVYQYPYWLGLKERDTAILYASNALGWTHCICAVHALTFAIPCAWAVFHRDWTAALGWGSQIILTTTSLYMFYLGSTYRNSNEFVNWSKASVISSITSLLFLPLVAFYNFLGVCVRYSIPGLFSMLYAHFNRPLKIKPRLDPRVLKKMIAFGAPLMIFAYIYTNLWTAIERSYVLKILNAEMLGVFAFAGTLCIALTTVAISISQVFNPRIAMLYGSSGNCLSTCLQYCVKCSLAGFVVMLPLVIITYWMIDPMVTYFLPKYVKSIPITRCLCWLSLIPVLDMPKQLLMVAKKNKQFAFSVVTSFGLYLSILAFMAYKKDSATLQAIAVASVSCKMIAVAMNYGLCWREAGLDKIRKKQ